MRVTLIDLWAREGMLHYSAQLGNNLARLPGMEVTVLVPGGSDVSLFEAAVTVDFVDVVKDASPRELLLAPPKLLKIPLFLKTIRQTKPDVIHLNNCHVWYLLTLPRMNENYPVVATLHDVEPHPGQDDSWRKRREIDALVRSSRRLFVHGEALKERLLALYPGLAADSIEVIPHGEYSFFTRFQTGVATDERSVLFFGRIRAYKGLDCFIQAANLVAQKIPRAKFVIAGDGDMRPYRDLLGTGASFEVHNRYIPDAEVARLFQRASIVALPYVEASQSGVVQIAFAFKKPVVTTSVGCLPDVVEDGQTGLLVPPGDVPALAEALVRLLSDSGLRETLGSNAYRRMKEEYGWDPIASTTQRVYRAVVREQKGRVTANDA